MKIYEVYEDGDVDEVRYYISKILAEEDLAKRLEEWPSCPAKIAVIITED